MVNRNHILTFLGKYSVVSSISIDSNKLLFHKYFEYTFNISSQLKVCEGLLKFRDKDLLWNENQTV